MTYSILIAMALSSAGEMERGSEATPPPRSANITKDSVPSEMLTKPWEGQYRAMAHARYHHNEASYYKAWDAAARASTLLVSALSMMGSAVWFATNRYVRRFLIFAGGVGFSVSLALNMSQWDVIYHDHAVLANRWSSLEQDWERLRHKKEDLKFADLASHIRKLHHDERTIENASCPLYECVYSFRKPPTFAEFRREFDRSTGDIGELTSRVAQDMAE